MEYHDQDSEHEIEFSAEDAEFYHYYLDGRPVVRQLIAEILSAEAESKQPSALEQQKTYWNSEEGRRYAAAADERRVAY